MSEFSLRGKISAGARELVLKIKLSVTSSDEIFIFLREEVSTGLGVILMLKSFGTEHRIPMTFSPMTYYFIEIYVLKKKNNGSEYHQLESCNRKRFQVPLCDPREDLEVCLEFEEEKKSYFPLSSSLEENVQLSIDQESDLKYIIKGVKTYDIEHRFIIILKVPNTRLQFFISTKKKLKYTLPIELPAGVECDLKIVGGTKILTTDNLTILKTEINSECLTFHTFFTKAEYQKLFDKMMAYIGTLKGTFLAIDYFYRNKSEMYFSSIMEYHNGVMKPYTKDHNGDPSSVINGNINGLFFSTMVEFGTNKPPPVSLFGPVRLHIEATTFLTPNLNLYFGDFYCHHQVHYITIIVTPKRSPTDKFCKKRLLKLDILNNPFVYLKECHEYVYDVMVFSCPGMRIEMFYTEPIHIREILYNYRGFFKHVGIIGKGASTPGGIPKNKSCKICNL